jgi:hypothetical protein
MGLGAGFSQQQKKTRLPQAGFCIGIVGAQRRGLVGREPRGAVAYFGRPSIRVPGLMFFCLNQPLFISSA